MGDHDHRTVPCPLCHGTGRVTELEAVTSEGSMSTWAARHHREEVREAEELRRAQEAADEHREE